MPYLILAVLLGAAGYGAYKLLGLAAEADKILPEIKPRIHKVTLSGIVIALDIVIKNPTNFKLHIIRPFLTIAYNNSAIVSSDVSNELIHINPFMESKRFTILVPVSYLSAVGPGAELLKKLQDKTKKVDFQVLVVSKILRDTGEPVGETVAQLTPKQQGKMMDYGKKIDVSL
jgi:hypothetical protein